MPWMQPPLIKQALDDAMAQLGSISRVLAGLARDCLNPDPAARPTASEALQRLNMEVRRGPQRAPCMHGVPNCSVLISTGSVLTRLSARACVWGCSPGTVSLDLPCLHVF